MELSRKSIINASAWVLGGHAIGQIFRLLSNLIMTRLLMPEMFGIMAIANVVMIGLALFSDLGLGLNIVQNKKGNDKDFLNVIWSIQIIRGFIIWLFALVISFVLYSLANIEYLPKGTVYSESILPFVIATISFTALTDGFLSTKVYVALRDMRQNEVVSVELISQLSGLMFMIFLGILTRNIWALVLGALITSIVKVCLSHLVLKGQSNYWLWNKIIFKEVFDFGKWIFLSSVIGFLLNNGDRILLGALIDSKTLGVYSIAFMMINVIQAAISKLNQSVVFPALSDAFRQPNDVFKNRFYSIKTRVDTCILIIAGFLVIAGSDIINILYDERYSGAGIMLQIYSIIFVAQRHLIVDQCLLAVGRPKIMTNLILIRCLSLYIFLPIGYHLYEIYGAIIGIVVSNFVGIPFILYYQNKHDILNLKIEIILLPFFVVGCLTGLLFHILYN